jgi:hypothetical protein
MAVVRTVVWLSIAVFAAAVGAEILLQYRAAWKERNAPRTVIGDLDRAYAPFIVQHLHPQYLFFFPLHPEERLAMGNTVVSLDRDGYREPGPAHAGGRKLAVMLGGSSAFGHYASSNETTITSYLNRLQDEYFFVNAGVPSWNSSQELGRLVHQVAVLTPALVVVYDGANDAELTMLFSPRTHRPYPPGTPESFDDLERWVDDIRSDQWQFRPPLLFPEIRHRIGKYMSLPDDDDDKDPIPDEGVTAAVGQYRANHERMALVSAAIGARFISVFQPVASLHRHVPEEFREEDAPSIRFHRVLTSAGAAPAYEFHDLATYFDGQMPSVPAGEPVGGAQPIFADDVHLFDRGNEMIAKRLLEIVRAPPPR